MMVYNVWVIVEAINEREDDDGQDVLVEKVGRFRTRKEAVDYATTVVEVHDTIRDEEGYS